MFKRKLENKYYIKIHNGINCVHINKVNKISSFNLLHDILNPPKCTKLFNSHYFPILNRFMNTQKGKAKFKSFRILFYIGCSYTIIMGRLMRKT